MIFPKQNADNYGALASMLCLLHCIATPFVFIAQSCAVSCCHTKPLWWKSIDYIFLAISFIAIRQAVKNSSKKWIKPALWLSWFMLFAVITNENLQWVSLNNTAIYYPSLTLIILHIYNLKYCKCNTSKCCTNE